MTVYRSLQRGISTSGFIRGPWRLSICACLYALASGRRYLAPLGSLSIVAARINLVAALECF